MKNINIYLSEALKINKDSASKFNQYTEHPDTKYELVEILKERLKKDRDADLNDIDVSNITDMCVLFAHINLGSIKPGNIKIDKWDVSNVTNMHSMFRECDNFNCDLSNWDVSSVENMNAMFADCSTFNSDLSNWDVSNVKSMSNIFLGCTSLKTLPSWYKA